MTGDLFADIPVRDYTVAATWYERLLGAPPSFLPNDTEAVWDLADGLSGTDGRPARADAVSGPGSACR